MPKAVAVNDTEKFDLKSCDGGFVELRRMTYGEKLERRQISMDMYGEGSGKQARVQMDLAASKTALFEFSRLVLDHNLEDENGTKLNLKSPTDLSRLDPRIGDEIEQLIADMDDFDSEGN
jgi:hypothetical protein